MNIKTSFSLWTWSLSSEEKLIWFYNGEIFRKHESTNHEERRTKEFFKLVTIEGFFILYLWNFPNEITLNVVPKMKYRRVPQSLRYLRKAPIKFKVRFGCFSGARNAQQGVGACSITITDRKEGVKKEIAIIRG